MEIILFSWKIFIVMFCCQSPVALRAKKRKVGRKKTEHEEITFIIRFREKGAGKMGKRLKPMGVAGILDNTFFILRDKFWQFQGVIFLSYLPAVIFGILAAVLLLPVVLGGIELLDTDSVEQMDQLFSGLLSSFGLYFFIVGGGFIVALILGSIYMAYGSIRLFSKGLHAEECRVREAFKGINGKRLRFK